jgi:hypothetical protein
MFSRISSAFVEAIVNAVVSMRFAKKQQMQWTRRGAHLLLQTRLGCLTEHCDRPSSAGILDWPTTIAPAPLTPKRRKRPTLPHGLPMDNIFSLSYRFSRIFSRTNGFVRMSIHENLTEFAGKPVQDFKEAGAIADFSAVAPRIRCAYDEEETLTDYLALLLEQPGAQAIEALVFGVWMDGGEAVDVTPQETVELLVASKDRLPNLKALFIGDTTSEENEISWIAQSDHSAIWAAFPKLEIFCARGANDLRLGQINHQNLHTLVVQSGGLPSIVVREALAANAPFRHFELWLGVDYYGANTSVSDFAPLLEGKLFPGLETLALRNCAYADELAEALAEAPILDRIETLDLSMGTLSDRGAKALLASPKLKRLKKLDVSLCFVSDELIAQLAAAGPTLVAEDMRLSHCRGEDDFYVAVSE